MMETSGSYEEYTRLALEQYARRDRARREWLLDAVKDFDVRRILDVGCGAGQEFFPFLENTSAVCYGVDRAESLGRVAQKTFDKEFSNRAFFVRAAGENLPFADAHFDLCLCLVALPYMNNRRTIAEIARVLRPGGALVLKIHATAFYLKMIRDRVKTLSAKQLAYPLICLAAGAVHELSGRQPEKGFWRGKEVFQTRRFLAREFARNGLKTVREIDRANKLSPVFIAVKN